MCLRHLLQIVDTGGERSDVALGRTNPQHMQRITCAPLVSFLSQPLGRAYSVRAKATDETRRNSNRMIAGAELNSVTD